MHPELIHLGAVHVRSFGLMIAIAFLFGAWLGVREAKRLGLDEDRLVNVVLAAMIAAVFGARLLFVIEHIEDFVREPASLIAVWQGGLTLYGGIAAGTLAGLVAASRLGLPRWVVADALAPSLALGTAFGRMGCFLNGCCYGKPTLLPWGVTFPPGSPAAVEFGVTPVHPSQLYNAAAGLLLFALMWLVRKHVRPAGVLFWGFIAVFALVRLPIDMTRTYETTAIVLRQPFVLTESQLTSLVMALFAVLMILRLRRAAAGPRA
jgi:phosphatidylglycerol:prolipoprotein diacylglycerol transferase